MATLQALTVAVFVISRFPSSCEASPTFIQAHSHRCGAKGKRLKINPNCTLNYSGVTTAIPSVTQRAILFGRVGFALYMNASGTVGGTNNISDKKTVFHIMSFGKGIVVLKHVQTGKYIGMNRRGRFKGKGKLDKNCLFAQTMTENHWINYASHKFYKSEVHDMFLGIQKKGDLKPACKTMYGQISIQFQVVPSGGNAWPNINGSRKNG